MASTASCPQRTPDLAAETWTGSTATTIADVTAAITGQTTISTYALRTNSSFSIASANTLTVAGGCIVFNGTKPDDSQVAATGTLSFTGENTITRAPAGPRSRPLWRHEHSQRQYYRPGRMTLASTTASTLTGISVNGGIVSVSADTNWAAQNVPLKNGAIWRTTGYDWNTRRPGCHCATLRAAQSRSPLERSHERQRQHCYHGERCPNPWVNGGTGGSLSNLTLLGTGLFQ